MREPGASDEGIISKVKQWLHGVAPDVRSRERLDLRNRSVSFETVSQLVGPAEPSQIISAMEISLPAEDGGELTIRITSRLSLIDILKRQSRSESEPKVKIDCDSPDVVDALRGYGNLLDRLASFNFNYLLFEEGILRLDLPTVLRKAEEKKAIAHLMCDFIELIESGLE